MMFKSPTFSTARSDEENYSKEVLTGFLLCLAFLDHTRLFFHYWNTNPGNLESTSPMLFFTRFISHFFAPAVFFMSGMRIYMWSKGCDKRKIFYTLIKFGFVLILTEAVLNNFLWTFNIYYQTLGLFIIGALGLSIIVLAFLQYLPKSLILLLSLLVLFGHHVLDAIELKGFSPASLSWYFLHQQKYIPVEDRLFIINYTIIPWFAILSSGYAIGYLYRRKWLLTSGISLVILFIILRIFNNYGESEPWVMYPDKVKTILSFFSLTKYPASLDFVAITLGPIFIVLHYLWGIRNGLTDFFATFGSVPLFSYLISTLIIHLVAMINLQLQGGSWSDMVITPSSYESGSPLSAYGYSLLTVYLFWLVFIGIIYACCRIYLRMLKAKGY